MDIEKKYERAQFFYKKGKFKKAQEICESIVKKNPDNLQFREILGQIYSKVGRNDLAIKHLRFVIDKNLSSDDSLVSLGKALVNVFDYVDAEKTFSRALELAPASIDARLGLSDVYLHTDRSVEAEKILVQINNKKPGLIDVIYKLGEVNFQHNNFENAKKHFLEVIKKFPSHSQAHYKLAMIYHISGCLEDAIEHYKKSVLIKPDKVDVYIDFGALLLIAGQFLEAEKIYIKAVNMDAESVLAVSGLITALSRNGKITDAYDRFKACVNKGVVDAPLAIGFAGFCTKLDKINEAKEYIAKVLSESDLDVGEEIKLNYVAGRLYDKDGDFEQAFDFFKSANHKRPDSFSPLEYSAYIDSIIKAYSQNNLLTLPVSSIETDKPIFIIGMPRSGTSLVEQILSSHSQVYGAGELREVGNYVHELPKILSTDKTYPNCLSLVNSDMLNDYAHKYIAYIEKVSSGEQYVTDKMPHNFTYLGFIAQMFPNAHIVHCVRDPRDVCLSIYFQNFHESHSYATRLENIVSYFNEYKSLMKHWKSVSPIPIYDVVYEDLVSNQESVTRGLLEFLGLDWDQKCLEFYKSQRSVATSSHDQVTEKMYTSSKSRWKNYEQFIGDVFDKLDFN